MSVIANLENVGFAYNETTHTTEDYEVHCHNHYEVYCFLEGDVDYLVEGIKYVPVPNSILLLAPHVFHGVKIKGTTPYRRYTLHFSPDILSLERRAFLLSAFASQTPDTNKQVYFENIDRFHIITFFEALKECVCADRKIKDQMIPINIEALLSQIVYMCESEVTSGQAQSDVISRIIWYLNRNLKDEITLDQLSEQFFISKHHLNKIFRKATGTTVFDYLIRKRISLAQHLLINGFSAQDAAVESGFDDYSSFYRSYVRILGHAPSYDKGGGPLLNYYKDSKMESVVLKEKSRI